MVRIESKNGISNGSKVFNEDGTEINGITKISIDLETGDIVKAKIHLGIVALNIEACPEFKMMHPKTGEFKKISKIEFADGEVVEF